MTNRKWFVRVFWSVLLLVGSLSLAPAPVVAQDAEDIAVMKELLGEADGIFDKRETAGKAKEAIKMYEDILAFDPNYADTYWKIARAYYWIGNQKSGDSDRLKAYKNGIHFAKLGIEKDADSVGCHFWLAVSYGKYGEVKGIMQSLQLIDPMKAELKTVIKLDDSYWDGGAYRVLGRLYFKLPGVKGGSNEKAIEHLNKAIKKGPKNLMNHRFLAEVYIDEGRKDEAKEILNKILEMPLRAGDEPESKMEKKKAKELLKGLE